MKKHFTILILICASFMTISAENVITITTSYSPHSNIYLGINAAQADQSDIWIDLNNDKIKDANEKVTDFSSTIRHGYTLKSQTISIYGNVSHFDCNHCSLLSFDVSKNTALSSIDCSSNNLDTLDFRNNTALKKLVCTYANLSSINLSNNRLLEELDCSNNNLVSINLDSNIKLKTIDCKLNALKALNTHENILLNYLMCSSNKITSLDFRKNTVLQYLWCDMNPVTSINLANGNNKYIKTMSASALDVSCCIQIDENFTPSSSGWAERYETNYSTVSCSSDIASLPKITLTTQKAIGSSLKLTIDAADSDKQDVWIDLNDNEIKDLGESIVTFHKTSFNTYTIGSQTIAIYGKITTLNCHSNEIISIDVSKNNELISFGCADNNLSTLNISENTTLKSLYCQENQLTALDVTQNKALGYISCYANNLKTLDLSQNIKLYGLLCSSNNLIELDLTHNPLLTSLGCYSNELTTLNLEINTLLNNLFCSHNKLKTLDLSKNTVLKTLFCEYNSLISLDLSKNTLIKNIHCRDNKLTAFNLANNNNAAIYYLDLILNPKLKCIKIDTGFTPDESKWKKDATANWSTSPCPPYVAVTGITLNKENLDLEITKDESLIATLTPITPTFDSITWNSSRPQIASVDAQGKVTGIALGTTDITATTYDGNFKAVCHVTVEPIQSITMVTTKQIGETISLVLDAESIDQSNIWIDLNNNGTKDINENHITFNTDITNNFIINSQTISIYGNLKYLKCRSLQLTEIDVSKNSVLEYLNCSTNQLTKLNIRNNINLVSLYCQFNQLLSLDIKSNIALQELFCSANQLSNLDVSKNTNLSTLFCYSNKLETLNLDQNTALVSLYCHTNKLNVLTLNLNTKLQKLHCYSNQLTELNLSQNTELKTVNCSYNKLLTLDISSNISVTNLKCNNNNLISLDLENNHNNTTYFVDTQHNPKLKCIKIDTGFTPDESKWKKDATANWSTSPCPPYVAVTGITLNKENLDLEITKDESLIATLTPITPTFDSITWNSSRPQIASVDAQGKVTGIALGTTDITATTYDGNFKAVCHVTVTPHKYRADIEDSPVYHIQTNCDHLRAKCNHRHNDTICVKKNTHIKDKLFAKTSTYPADLFEVVAVTKDSKGHDIFIPTTHGSENTTDFDMPECSVRITAKINIKSNTSANIPNAIDYLEFHEGSTLDNLPLKSPTQIDNLIMYKRTFNPSTWYTISFPFTVNRITVIEDNNEYDITPCSSTQGTDGNFYLKYIEDNVQHGKFKSSWQYEKGIDKIQKNKSYIIAFPSTYYANKEIIFYGEKQTINDNSNKFTTTLDQSGKNYNYRGNTSFQNQIVENPYLLNASGTYFEMHQGSYTLKPFTSYVHSVFSSNPSAAPRKLSFNDVLNPKKDPTNTNALNAIIGLEYYVNDHQVRLTSTIQQKITIVSINAQIIHSLTLKPNQEQSIHLESGAYVINSANNQHIKIIIL